MAFKYNKKTEINNMIRLFGFREGIWPVLGGGTSSGDRIRSRGDRGHLEVLYTDLPDGLHPRR